MSGVKTIASDQSMGRHIHRHETTLIPQLFSILSTTLCHDRQCIKPDIVALQDLVQIGAYCLFVARKNNVYSYIRYQNNRAQNNSTTNSICKVVRCENKCQGHICEPPLLKKRPPTTPTKMNPKHTHLQRPHPIANIVILARGIIQQVRLVVQVAHRKRQRGHQAVTPVPIATGLPEDDPAQAPREHI